MAFNCWHSCFQMWLYFVSASQPVSFINFMIKERRKSFLFTLHGKQTILQLAEEHGHCRKQTALNGLGGIVQTFSPFVSRKGFCYSFYLCAYRSVSCVRVGALSQKSASELWDPWHGCHNPSSLDWVLFILGAFSPVPFIWVSWHPRGSRFSILFPCFGEARYPMVVARVRGHVRHIC